MIKSMTGYGLGTIRLGKNQISVRVRSVNSRFLDLKIRGLEFNPELELKIRERITNELKRGSVQVTVDYSNNFQEGESITFNRNRYEAIEAILLSIQKEYGRRIEMSDIISADDLFTISDPSQMDSRKVMNAVEKALTQVEDMRVKEGEKIKSELENRVQTMDEKLSELETLSENLVFERKEKYSNRIKELLHSIPFDENRIAQEIAIQSDKADTSEEIVRCGSHISQFRSFMKLDEPVGKRFNFLLQEIGREVNTIGSKNSDVDIANLVIDLKVEIEKIREQVQNII